MTLCRNCGGGDAVFLVDEDNDSLVACGDCANRLDNVSKIQMAAELLESVEFDGLDGVGEAGEIQHTQTTLRDVVWRMENREEVPAGVGVGD